MKTRFLVICCSLALISCEGSHIADPDASPELVRRLILPDQGYRLWWDEVKTCAGLGGDMDRVRFFEVVSPVVLRGEQFPCGAGKLCNGIWERPHNITLAPAMLRTARLVKHEMLHDLLDNVEHPPVFDECQVDWPVIRRRN